MLQHLALYAYNTYYFDSAFLKFAPCTQILNYNNFNGHTTFSWLIGHTLFHQLHIRLFLNMELFIIVFLLLKRSKLILSLLGPGFGGIRIFTPV